MVASTAEPFITVALAILFSGSSFHIDLFLEELLHVVDDSWKFCPTVHTGCSLDSFDGRPAIALSEPSVHHIFMLCLHVLVYISSHLGKHIHHE